MDESGCILEREGSSTVYNFKGRRVPGTGQWNTEEERKAFNSLQSGSRHTTTGVMWICADGSIPKMDYLTKGKRLLVPPPRVREMVGSTDFLRTQRINGQDIVTD